MDDCIEWEGRRNNGNYGVRKGVRPSGRRGDVRAHRAAYAEHHGLDLADIDGKVVMHVCDNPPCVNVEHLRLGTQSENLADMRAKGRGRTPPAAGSLNGRAKLTESQVRDIRVRRNLHGEDPRDLAEYYGVYVTMINRIARGAAWKHVA